MKDINLNFSPFSLLFYTIKPRNARLFLNIL
nr:MAG TPA: hypothetical protein [Caudoviricetes sp.]